MVLIPVFCPHCQSDQVIKGGTTQVSKQRYKCQNAACPHYSFQLDLTYKGRSPEIKDRIIRDGSQWQRHPGYGAGVED